MIDKKIFYCWFGNGEMTELNKKCIASWEKYCPDYEIIKIDESNFDYHITPYAETAYEHGNWSYVSNAARLETLKHNSGFYLDTDVQLTKSLDELRIFDKGFITEFDSGQPDSGVLGCGSDYSAFYDEVYSRLLPGTILHKEFIQVLYRDYDVHGETMRTYPDGFAVLGEEWFPSVRTGCYTGNTVGIHFFENTWCKQWQSVTDGFYPYAKVRSSVANKLTHVDEGAEINVNIKHINLKWNSYEILGRMNYFFNPNVIKISTREFEAERINYDKLAPQHVTITPMDTIVTWI